MNIPYTYYIEWSSTGVKYYGVRYAHDCHPSDLFVTYFTSSDYVTEYIKEHGNPDIIQVRREFVGDDRRIRAQKWETDVLKRIRAKERDDYLNKNDGQINLPLSPEVEKRRVEKITATKNKPENLAKVSGLNWWSTDKTIYTFVHKDGRVETCTRVELCEKYGLRADKLTRMLNGTEPNRKSHGGWSLEGVEYADRTGTNRPNYDYTIYEFIHDSGIIEKCTRHELYTKYGLRSSNIYQVITGGKKSHKGWRLYHTKKNCPSVVGG